MPIAGSSDSNPDEQKSEPAPDRFYLILVSTAGLISEEHYTFSFEIVASMRNINWRKGSMGHYQRCY